MDRGDDDNTTGSDDICIKAVDWMSSEEEWIVKQKANASFINFKLNTGIQANVLPETVLLTLKENLDCGR